MANKTKKRKKDEYTLTVINGEIPFQEFYEQLFVDWANEQKGYVWLTLEDKKTSKKTKK